MGLILQKLLFAATAGSGCVAADEAQAWAGQRLYGAAAGAPPFGTIGQLRHRDQV